MTSMPSQRPALTRGTSAPEFARWYWNRSELVAFARELGLRTAGSKQLLAARIEAALAGREFVEPTVAAPSPSRQLVAPLTPDSLIPVGQRCSRVVRDWLSSQVGSAFHFDVHMRRFFGAADGTTTMQDALDHWRATRDQAPVEIGAQFEFNRFTREWYHAHPRGSRADCLAAWREYRSRPVDERTIEW